MTKVVVVFITFVDAVTLPDVLVTVEILTIVDGSSVVFAMLLVDVSDKLDAVVRGSTVGPRVSMVDEIRGAEVDNSFWVEEKKRVSLEDAVIDVGVGMGVVLCWAVVLIVVATLVGISPEPLLPRLVPRIVPLSWLPGVVRFTTTSIISRKSASCSKEYRAKLKNPTSRFSLFTSSVTLSKFPKATSESLYAKYALFTGAGKLFR